MAYSTQADILLQIDEARLIQLTDDEGSGTIDANRVERAIADADEEIDGYLGSIHRVPISPAPRILRKLSVDIAIYNLYRRMDNMTDQRAEAYKNAIRFLEQVAMGKISLGAEDPGGSPPDTGGPEISTANPARTFTRSTMEGF